METPQIDMTQSQAVLDELLDDDRSVKERFTAHFGPELKELSDRFAEAFLHLPTLYEAANKDGRVQAALVAAFAFCVLDDILVSSKVLLTGKLMPAGNLMRQAVEGIAVVIMCACDGLLIVETRKKSPTTARYWKLLEAADKRVHSHHALAQLEYNRLRLQIAQANIDRLKAAKKHYNQFSHPNLLGFAAKVDLAKAGTVYAGGHFDDEKIEGYRIELRERIGLVGILPNLFDELAKQVGAYEQP